LAFFIFAFNYVFNGFGYYLNVLIYEINCKFNSPLAKKQSSS